ncbi:hypothetical protein RAA17_19995 [Komagataeibacter rhaeticus]|nr:hypothetical protein [Komagataeibacter rhaeticus]
MQPDDPPRNPASRQRQVGLVIVATCTSASLAILVLLPLVSGLVNLLRDILGVLILPFSFMFGLEGAEGSPRPAAPAERHGIADPPAPAAAGGAAILELVAVFLFVIAERLGAAPATSRPARHRPGRSACRACRWPCPCCPPS